MVRDEPQRSLDALSADLQQIFGDRLRSLVVYGDRATAAATEAPRSQTTPAPDRVHTLALVDRVTFPDLSACASKADVWLRKRLAVPLLLGWDEFARSLDTFPLEYGDIIADHRLVAGDDPFVGVAVAPEDLRRACEVQAKSHLIHLREGFIEAGGRPADVARLIVASAGSFATVLANVARLHGVSPGDAQQLGQQVEAGLGLSASLVQRVTSLRRSQDLPASQALELYPAYLEAAERLWRFVDGWGLGAHSAKK